MKTMAFVKICSLLSLFIIENAYGQTDVCRNQCESTYRLHTTDKVESLHACLTGCRLSSITQLSSEHVKQKDVLSMCTKDCTHAYDYTSELTYACNLGCKSQKIIPTASAILQHELDRSGIEIHWQTQLMHPVVIMGNYCSGMFHRVTAYISPSYVIEDSDGSTIMMQFQMSPGNPVQIYENREDEISELQEHMQGREKSLLNRAYKHGSKWLNCVEAKAGIPYWTLVTILFLSLFFITWVCCNSCGDEMDDRRNKKHVFSGELSISANDMEKMPLFTVPSVDVAGPLPEKTKFIS